MKKLLCLLMAVVLVFAFAACGGDKGDGDGANAGATNATAIVFDAESYSVGVDGYITISDHVTVTPAGAKVVYSSSDETIAELSSVKGEFYGVKGGEVTVTAKSEDGKVVATCKLVVEGKGNVIGRDDETNVGGITNKRYGHVERPDDNDAIIILINTAIANNDGADMSNAVALNYGEVAQDGSAAAYYDGYYIAKTGGTGNYKLENIPEGKYDGIIISSQEYSQKLYDVATSVAAFKATAMAKYFTDAEINTMVGAFFNREFYVQEVEVKANENTVFGYDFAID